MGERKVIAKIKVNIKENLVGKRAIRRKSKEVRPKM
jgi:hypothetical protein